MTQDSGAYPPQDTPVPAETGDAYPPPENDPADTPGVTPLTATAAESSQTTPTPTGSPDVTPGISATPTPTQSGTTATPNPEQTPALSQTPTITQSPTVTMTPTKVRSVLEASNPEDFSPVSGSVQLVTIFAEWHPNSQAIAPVLLYFEDRFSSQVIFTYLDYDDPGNAMYASLVANRELPVIFLLDADGKVLDEWEGIVLQDVLEAAILSALSGTAP